MAPISNFYFENNLIINNGFSIISDNLGMLGKIYQASLKKKKKRMKKNKSIKNKNVII